MGLFVNKGTLDLALNGHRNDSQELGWDLYTFPTKGNRIVGGVVSGIQAIESKGHVHFCLNYVRWLKGGVFHGLDEDETLPVNSTRRKMTKWVRRYLVLWHNVSSPNCVHKVQIEDLRTESAIWCTDDVLIVGSIFVILGYINKINLMEPNKCFLENWWHNIQASINLLSDWMDVAATPTARDIELPQLGD